jgi:hypothetical protein
VDQKPARLDRLTGPPQPTGLAIDLVTDSYPALGRGHLAAISRPGVD